MDTPLLLVSVFLYSSVRLSVGQNKCPYKECDCYYQSVQCGDRNLTAMPRIVDTNFTTIAVLIVDNNGITTIPAGRLPANLPALSFRNNPLATIDDTALDSSSTTLSSMYFSNTRLTRIPNAFGHLHALTYLSISGAAIVDWNENAIKNMGSTLLTLHLEHVGFTTWPTWLQPFSKVRTLMISGTTISFIPDNAFDNLINTLTSVTLTNNSLTAIPKALSKLTKLNMLYLEHNLILNIAWFPSSNVLSTVHLNGNGISDAVQLAQLLHASSKTLSDLDITNNKLTTMPDISFLTLIQSIDLSHNAISDTTSAAVPPHMRYLNLGNNSLKTVPHILASLVNVTIILLSSNSIKEIHATDFHLQTVSVDVSHNLITALTDTSFHENSKITRLLLGNNPITQISSGSLKNLPNLATLELQSTQLTRMPLSLSNLKKIKTIDVSNSTSLVCTCTESSLKSWVTKLKEGSVLGTCGQTSVYYFYSHLAGSCS